MGAASYNDLNCLAFSQAALKTGKHLFYSSVVGVEPFNCSPRAASADALLIEVLSQHLPIEILVQRQASIMTSALEGLGTAHGVV